MLDLIHTDLKTSNQDLKSHFSQDGVIVVRQVFNKSEVDDIRDLFTKQVEEDPKFASIDKHIDSTDILSRYPRFVHPHRHGNKVGQTARNYLIDERLVDVATRLFGDVYGAQTMFYFKPPTARGQAFHQDNHSLRANPGTCLAAWVAIDDSDASNGGLRVLPGSHKNKLLCHDAADMNISFSANGVRVPIGAEIKQTELRAGDVLFFHGNLVHGSLPNNSDKFRRALIFHYIPQYSTEVSEFYLPLIAPDGTEVSMGSAALGGPCGVDWAE